MTYSIVRLYGNEQNASDAVRKLKEAGFSDDIISHVSPVTVGEGGSAESASKPVLASALKAGGELGEDAAFYAERVRSGRSLIVVRVPFGFSERAMTILDSCKPVDKKLRPPRERDEWQWSDGTPLSESFCLPVLSKNPAPLSSFAGFPTLSRGQTPMGSLASSSFALTSMFGMPLLSRRGTPLSSMFGLKLLSKSSGPMRSRLGFPLLLNAAAPLSAMLALPRLSKNATPLSSLFSLPLLADGR